MTSLMAPLVTPRHWLSLSLGVALSLGVVLPLGACTTTPSGGSTPAQADASARSAPLQVSELRESAISTLVELAGHERADVRANAIEAISFAPRRAEAVVRAGLDDENTGVRAVSALVVGRARLRALTGPCRVALGGSTPARERISAIYALRSCGEDADPTPIGVELLGASDLRVRAHAAYVLGELGDASAAPMLREASAAVPTHVGPIASQLLRLQIAEALIKLGDDEERSVVRAALYPARPSELEAAALAAQIIGEVGDREAIDQLIYLTASRNEVDRPMPAEVRLAATGALSKMGLQDGSFVAVEYLAADSEPIRAQAALVLGDVGRRANLPRLAPMLEDPSPLVRVAAAGAILKITSR